MSGDGAYRKVLGVTIPPAKKSAPPAPGVVVQGAGWRVNVPLVVLASLASAIGARMMPTPSPTDTAINEMRAGLQTRDLRDEQFRHEIRQELSAIRERADLRDNEMRNRFTILEVQLARQAGR